MRKPATIWALYEAVVESGQAEGAVYCPASSGKLSPAVRGASA
jgi:hypothetical protein